MNLVATDSKDKFNEQLAAEIESRLEPEIAGSVRNFARRFFHSIPLEEIAGLQISDLYGAIFGWWNFAQSRQPDEVKIATFNPTLEEEGWLSGRTEIIVLHRDMPFLVDSIRIELNRRRINIHSIHSVALFVARDDSGQLLKILPGQPEVGAEVSREAAIHIEIGRRSSIADREELAESLRSVLRDVALVVDDFEPMIERTRELLEELEKRPPANLPVEETAETREFLRWVIDNHFTFLGLAEYEVVEEAGARALRELTYRRLGVIKNRRANGCLEFLHDMHPGTARMLLEPRVLGFSKSSVRSRVHRSAHPDYITVKRFDAQGELVGEVRFLGLYTSRVYTISPFLIPIIREKVEFVMTSSGLRPGGHEGKDLQHVLEVFPRDELFQSSAEELSATAIGIMRIQERRKVRLFVREDGYGRFVTCLVFIPRDQYNTNVRNKVEAILCEAFGAEEAEFNIRLAESVLAQVHFVMRIDPSRKPSYDVSALEEMIVDVTRTWESQFTEALVEAFGEEEGTAVAAEYEAAFPLGYKEDFDPRSAVNDVRRIQELGSEEDISMSFYRPVGTPENSVRFRLFHLAEMLPLSDIMPILEKMGLRVVGEHPYVIHRRDGTNIWIHDFQLVYGLAETIDVHEVRENFQEAFANIWYGVTESDGFNRLLLGTSLGWREVALLRAYARYMKQIAFHFSVSYIAATLSRHLSIAEKLVSYFEARFDPELHGNRKVAETMESELKLEIEGALEKVESLDEDRIIRRYMDLIESTVRSNYFRCDAEGKRKNYFAFKLLPGLVPDMPQPLPLFEVFVYSPRVEGVHLRGGKVARGGLRWSDRKEDYRTEVLGLVKAQQVKNAVIVPVGAKGGFVAKRLPEGGTPEERQREGIACYRIFIQALLDLTDNMKEGEVVPATDLVRKDDDDVYLVVAADKGTATFSDLANEISKSHGFWMGDGFASGGSVGYDHKKIGITARGAWLSVRRHFRERGVDVRNENFSVLGIGDMSGDVFGNGMLQSKHIQLLAAFNHRDIFLDPNPDPEISFAERERLFASPRSSWSDYDSAKISEGGGVYARNAKAIQLTPEVCARFGLEAESLTPNELIHALLKTPVDLIWNGGIGTYVKSSEESHAEAGDKANDVLRVDGRDLRCRVVGEGGNLGLTQLGRVEFALAGGALNTDFIDNVGGVDCSDHEVNIKILLNEVVASGDMTEKQRRNVLMEMTDSVAELVLNNNYRQAQAISMAEHEAFERMGEYRRFISGLESSGRLDRQLEAIPDDEALAARRAQGKGLVRPELCVLNAYAKGNLKEDLAESDLPDDPYLGRAVERAFPVKLREEFNEQIYKHRLHREIVATQMANDLVDHMGFTFVARLRESTGTTSPSVVRAYVAARDIFGLREVWRDIEALNWEVPVDLQLTSMIELRRMVHRASRWLIRNRRCRIDVGAEVERFGAAVRELSRGLDGILCGELLADWQQGFDEFCAKGLPKDLAHYLAGASILHTNLGIVEASLKSGAKLMKVAEVFFALGDRLELHWFGKQLAKLGVENFWQVLARESAQDDLDWQQRALTVSVLQFMQNGESADEGITRWLAEYGTFVRRWQSVLTELHGSRSRDFAMYSVALRELLDLAQSSAHHAADPC